MRGFLNASDMLLDMYGIKPTLQPDAAQRALLDAIELSADLKIKTTRDYTAEVMPTAKAKAPNGAFVQKQAAYPHLEKDCVVLNLNADKPDWYRTLFHELAHATGVAKRLGRFTVDTNVKGAVLHVEECIADKAAHKLMHHFGLLTNEVALDCLWYFDKHFNSATLYDSTVDLGDINRAADAAANLVIQWCENTALNYKKAV